MVPELMRQGRLLLICILVTAQLAPAGCDPGATPAPRGPPGAARPGPAPPSSPSGDPPAAAPVESSPLAGFGVVGGRVIYRGPLPATTTMFVPEAGNLEAHTIIVEERTRGLKNAVVWVESAPPRTAISGLEPAVLDQRKWTFVPHVLAVRRGQTVRFTNSDVANHNVHSRAPGDAFNLSSPGGDWVTHRFRRLTETDPVLVSCDIHDWMRAWVYVFPHDAFGVTDADGRFRIAGVPAGSHRLRVHHADGRLSADLEVVVESDSEAHVEIEVRG